MLFSSGCICIAGVHLGCGMLFGNDLKPRQNGRKMTSFRGAMGWHGQAGSWRGQ